MLTAPHTTRAPPPLHAASLLLMDCALSCSLRYFHVCLAMVWFVWGAIEQSGPICLEIAKDLDLAATVASIQEGDLLGSPILRYEAIAVLL